jgi:PhzF family phenazine biosynthesis protein
MEAWLVDTFADEIYLGNPAAVISLSDGFPLTRGMQSIANSLGLPTTAFLVAQGRHQHDIRWFTPEQELNICGHATIASAAYLYDIGGADKSAQLCFQTRCGPLYARRDDRHISLQLPQMEFSPCEPPVGLEEALGARIIYCARAIDDILVEVESEDVVANLQPDFEALKKIKCRGHVVTARGDQQGADFVSRSFFPALGVDEDQVCVSAHCKLGPYWADKLNKDELTAVQLSRRGGRLILSVRDGVLDVAGTAIVREVRCLGQTSQVHESKSLA